jgi:hypothetical protein
VPGVCAVRSEVQGPPKFCDHALLDVPRPRMLDPAHERIRPIHSESFCSAAANESRSFSSDVAQLKLLGEEILGRFESHSGRPLAMLNSSSARLLLPFLDRNRQVNDCSIRAWFSFGRTGPEVPCVR